MAMGNVLAMPNAATTPRSHSQLSGFLDCGRAFELSRVLGIKRRPGVWFPGGTAVHASIERYLRSTLSEGDR